MKIVSIGEVLWDVIEGQEYLGGAPFNFAAHMGRLGHTVFFVSGVGRDQRGERVLQKMAELGLSTQYVCRVEEAATGWVEVTLEAGGQPHFIIHRPAAYDFVRLSEPELQRLASERPDWIYFGTLMQMSPQAKSLTMALLASNKSVRRFYDVNLRPECYEAALVRELMSQATVVKLNEDEAAEIAQMFGRPQHASLEEFCRSYSRELGWEAVCVTRGARGCALLIGDEYISKPMVTRWRWRIRWARATPLPRHFFMGWAADGRRHELPISLTAWAPWSQAAEARFLHGAWKKQWRLRKAVSSQHSALSIQP